MKKLLIVMLGAMVALTSCLKSDLDGISNGGEVTVTLSASMSGAGSTTRADYTPGDGTTVDRCILEVYIQGGSLYKRMETSVTDALTATFDLRLVSSQSYEFLLWADKGGDEYADALYITNNEAGLKGITTSYDEYAGNNEERDAFYDAIEMEITNSTVINAELTRPFGQVNVKTYLTDVPADMYPASVSVLYTTKVYNTFNVLDGTLSGDETAIEWYEAAPVMDGETGTDDEVVTKYIDLSTEYLFASDSEQNLHKFAMTFYDAAGDEITTNENFVNIPVQRNYRTNISGELLTKQGSVNVEITPDFTDTDDYTTGEVFVADVEALNAILSAGIIGDVAFHVANVSGTQTVTIPADCVAASISIYVLSIEAAAEVTVAGTEYAGNVYFYSPLGTQFASLTINTPEAHVEAEINVDTTSTITSASTFVVLPQSIIGTLTVEQGSVEVQAEAKVATVAVAPAVAEDTESTIVINGTVEELKSTDDSVEAPAFSSNIYNSTQECYAMSLKAAVVDAIEGDVIELAEATYTLAMPDTTNTDYTDPDALYLLINKANLTIKAQEGADRSKVIIKSEDVIDSSIAYSRTQYGVIRVTAANFTLEGITYVGNNNINMPFKSNGVVVGYMPGRAIYAGYAGADGLTIKNCDFIANTFNGFTTGVGSIQIQQPDAPTSVFENCSFQNVGFNLDGSNDYENEVITFTDCTFDGMHRSGSSTYYLAKANIPYTNFDGCTFTNIYNSTASAFILSNNFYLSFNGCTINENEDFADYVSTGTDSTLTIE